MFKTIDLLWLKIQEKHSTPHERNGFVKTDDIVSKVGTLSMYCPDEHGPYSATLPAAPGGKSKIVLKIHTDGYEQFSIYCTIDGKPFEDLEDDHFGYDYYRKDIGWKGDFKSGWMHFDNPYDFHRVATALWGAWGVVWR